MIICFEKYRSNFFVFLVVRHASQLCYNSTSFAKGVDVRACGKKAFSISTQFTAVSAAAMARRTFVDFHCDGYTMAIWWRGAKCTTHTNKPDHCASIVAQFSCSCQINLPNSLSVSWKFICLNCEWLPLLANNARTDTRHSKANRILVNSVSLMSSSLSLSLYLPLSLVRAPREPIASSKMFIIERFRLTELKTEHGRSTAARGSATMTHTHDDNNMECLSIYIFRKEI